MKCSINEDDYNGQKKMDQQMFYDQVMAELHQQQMKEQENEQVLRTTQD